MQTRSENKFIGFILLFTAYNGWSWSILKDPLTLYLQAESAGYTSEARPVCGPYFSFDVHPLVDGINCFSQVGAVLLIGLVFMWLAYYITFNPVNAGDYKHTKPEADLKV